MMFKQKPQIDKDAIMNALKTVNDPELHRSIVDLGMVGQIEEHDGKVKINIKLTIPGCPLKHKIHADITAALASIEGITKVDLEFSYMTPEERMALTGKMTGQTKSALFDDAKIGNIIAVASGKGGVGKSTVTVNLAYSLKNAGYSVGIVDADVYGFSIPRMMGVQTLPTVIDETMIPVIKDGIKVMSMGFFVEEDQAVIWRGPMLHKAIVQFLTQVFWDKLDYLLIDLPPGTGDVTLSISQTVREAQLLVVTTPQAAAANVAQRVAELAKKANFKLLGIAENMSYFIAPDGSYQYIFGSGGGQELADKLGCQLFCQIPLDSAIREGGDSGKPVASLKVSPAVAEFELLAKGINEKLAKK
jgi:ATP-binding protein involved in chromosome partitioning